MNVLIIGDVMLDHYLYGECSRISPEAPVPVVNIKKEEWRLGGAANVANNLVALNTSCTLIGVYGMDEYARQFDLLLDERCLINNSLCTSEWRPTVVKSRVLVSGHQMIRMDRESISYLTRDEQTSVISKFHEEVVKSDIILVSDYCKGVLSDSVLDAIFSTCAELKKVIIVDPKSPDFTRYKGATIIKPNRKEAEQATGIKINSFASLDEASKMIKGITGAEVIITTLSEDGVGLYMDDTLQIIPTRAQKVFDVTGAGDTYLAAFTYEYIQTADTLLACKFANFAAGVVVAKIGSSTATLEEINQIINEFSYYES